MVTQQLTTLQKLVSRQSAVPDADYTSEKLRKNHINMVKFISSTDEDYITALWHLKKLISERCEVPTSQEDVERRTLETTSDVPARGMYALKLRSYGGLGKHISEI
jgi:hypothetical protein